MKLEALKCLYRSPGYKKNNISKLCPVIPTSNQDGRQAKNRKKGG
jgi:hypothetical protein